MNILLPTTIILLCLAISTTVSSQSPASNAPSRSDSRKQALLVDEFGRSTDCEVGARVDNFFIQLNNNPDAVGYVITYPGLYLLPSEVDAPPNLRRILMNIAFRRYDPTRVVFLKGGYQQSEMTEFYLVASGGVAPLPKKGLAAPKAPKGSFLWSRSDIATGVYGLDEFVLDSVKEEEAESARLQEIEDAKTADTDDNGDKPIGEPKEVAVDEDKIDPAEQEFLRFGWFDERIFTQLAQLKEARGTIIFYADDERYDIGKLKLFVIEARNRFAKESNVSPDLMSVKFGGYRDYEQVEYWIIPKGGKAPKASPEERPVAIEQESPTHRF